MKFAVLIPALDCGRTIGSVVAGARAQVESVLVVNDGSVDATSALARAAGAEVIDHAHCQGKGAALLSGFQRLRQEGFDYAITVDGDGQHLPGEIGKLLAVARANPEAIVIGERVLEGVEVAPLRLFGNRFANRWVEIACGRQIPDTQSGFRGYPLSRTLALGVRSRRFSFETEVLIRAARAGLDILSLPVAVYYPPAAERISHYRPFVDTLRIIGVVVGLILRLW